MRQKPWFTGVLVFAMLSLLLTPAVAAEAKDPAVGNWLLTSDFNGRPVTSLLMVSKTDTAGYAGNWVNFWGINPVTELKIQDGKISFTQSNRFRDREMTFKFDGNITDDKMTGTMTSDQGDNEFTGSRIKPMPAVVGTWEFRSQRQDREFISTLIVSRDNDGQFTADWQSRRDNEQDSAWEISDVKYDDEKLSFTRKSTNPERQRQTSYTLTAENDTISGTMTSPRGERQLEGKRLGGDLIGMWELTMTSDFGERKQLLWIQPDLTALFGATDVGTVQVEDGQISFSYELSFGERSFENAFKGTLENGSLTGEMTNSRGTQQVKGKKMPAPAK
jgi:hypothetical protein